MFYVRLLHFQVTLSQVTSHQTHLDHKQCVWQMSESIDILNLNPQSNMLCGTTY